MFGRKGDWQTALFANKVKSLEVWEIEKDYESDLKKNLPNVTIKIHDSIEFLTNGKNLSKFELILIDNPMNVFGPIDERTASPMYCEHFDVLRNIGKIVGQEAIIIFNVNRMPFDYSKFEAWKLRRNEFYQNLKTDDMSINFLHDFYKKFFLSSGFHTEFCFNVIRVTYKNTDMTYYFAYKIKRFSK